MEDFYPLLEEGEESEELDLTEESSDEYSLTESDNPYVLGTLEGVFFGPMEEENANGRVYEKSVGDKKIVNDPYTKNMIANKCLLGEHRHPQDRTSIWLNEACISTTSLKLSDDGKYIIGKADILNTPKGRTVWTLAKYGSHLGISARANGKGVKQKGKLVIKPENYSFKTFDVVLNPGFGNKARPTIKDSKGNILHEEISFYEDIKSLILEESSDKEKIREFIQYCEDDSLKSLLPLLEDVQNSANDLNEGASDKETISSLEAKVDQLSEEIAVLQTLLDSYSDDATTDVLAPSCTEDVATVNSIAPEVDSLLEEVLVEEESYQNQILELKVSNEDLESRATMLEEEVDELSAKLNIANDSYSDLQDKYDSLCESYNDLLEKLQSKEEENDSLLEYNKSVAKDMNRFRELYEESLSNINNLEDSVNILTEENEQLSSKVTCQRANVNVVSKRVPSSVDYFSTTDVQMVNEEATEEPVISDGRVNFIKSLGGFKS